MITAVDTNIILDILIPGEPFGASSKQMLERHLSMGKLVICEVVFAELSAGFPSDKELDYFLSDTGIRVVFSNQQSLFLAGSRWKDYKTKSDGTRFLCGTCGHHFQVPCPQCQLLFKKRLHVLSDFLIGAHALILSDGLLSRGMGIYKTYFKDLKVFG